MAAVHRCVAHVILLIVVVTYSKLISFIHIIDSSISTSISISVNFVKSTKCISIIVIIIINISSYHFIIIL